MITYMMNRHNLKPKSDGSYSNKNKELLRLYLAAKENNCENTVKKKDSCDETTIKQGSMSRGIAKGEE